MPCPFMPEKGDEMLTDATRNLAVASRSPGLGARRQKALRTNLTAFLFLLPTLALLAVFTYQPTANVLYHSFFRWDGFHLERFVGFNNYINLVRDETMHIAVRNLGLFLLGWMLQRIAPFAVAELVFNLKREKAKYWYRTLFVLPMVIPFLVNIMIWKFIYNPMPQIGMLNRLLGSLGLASLQRPWLADMQTVIPALLFIGFPWVSGWAFMIFYAGLQQVPTEVLDAAVIDGCNTWQRILRVDIPLMVSSIRLIAIQTMMSTIQEFSFILLMTNGGPAKASVVPGLLMYLAAFRGSDMGWGAAVGVVMFIVILALTLLSFRYTSSPFERKPKNGA